MDDQSVDTEVAAEEKLLAQMGEDDQQPDEVEDEESEAETDEEVSEQEQPESPPAEIIELTVNGEKIKKSREEVIELAQKGTDYTQKTQQLAEERRYVHAQLQQAQQQAQVQGQLVEQIAEAKAYESQLQQYQGLDWNTLVDSDPIQAMKLDRQYRELQNAYQMKVNEIGQMSQQVTQKTNEWRQEVLAKEYQSLIHAVPDWSDSAKFSTDKTEIKSFLEKSGFTDAEISNAADHRQIVIARKAMLYDKLMSAKPTVDKKVSVAPKPVKPGANTRNVSKEAYTNIRADLKRTGRTDAAERAIAALL